MSFDTYGTYEGVHLTRTFYLYDGGQLLCELDGSGNVLATNTWGGSLLSRRTGSASTFYTFDPSGNIAQRLDGAGNVLGAYAFDAFGLRTGTDATTDPYSSFGGQYGYYTDAETGLELLGHRYYDTATGRFLTRDPISYDGGINLYAYTQNNPVNWMDPDGTDSVDNAIMAISVTYGGLEGGLQGGALGFIGGTLVEPGGGTIVGTAGGVYAGAGIGAGIGAGVGGLAIALRHRIMEMSDGSRPPNMFPPGSGRRGAFGAAKRHLKIPRCQHPSKVGPNKDLQDRIRPGRYYEFDRPTLGGGSEKTGIRDDAEGEFYGEGNPQNRGSHFNAPPKRGEHFDY